MFYSQFILAKKGPLGTIWIAAHLERKLRKNQVADTDIGVSVDSILFPDVPIALRLSSHLLLGVVRIYSRKVNYLFDDCSEALLKVKQAFRSAAVDLPPEESKAPYHSITLPETFDLDDFELPENDMFHGNDHHISSKEQITLQDTMEGVSYSTSKFGLDERFGDGDTSGLDLDEELILDKIGSTGSLYESADPQASVEPHPFKQDEHVGSSAINSENLVGGVDEYADLIDYAQAPAPATPGLMEKPNVSSAHEVSACDDLIDPENHFMETENASKNTSDYKKEEKWQACDKINSSSTSFVQTEENEHSCGLKSNPQGEIPIEASLENTSVNGCSSGCKPTFDSQCQDNTRDTALDLAEVVEASVDFQNGEADKPELSSHPVDQSGHDDQSIPQNFGAKASLDLSSSNLDVHGKDSSTVSLKPCMSTIGHSDKPVDGCDVPNDAEVQLDDATFLNSGGGEAALLGLKEPELPDPEKLLSVPEGVTNVHTDMLIEGSYGGTEGLGEDDSLSKLVTTKKRTFTESTLTEQSLNSAESSRHVRFKRTAESVPNDDDLLSSILVGRSSVLKVKPTPRHSEVTSSKWARSTARNPAKRKVLMDDTMVLHGDMIRKQLMDTEDIRRVRKKAPCTRPEISMIKNQLLEDEIFLEPVFNGISAQLASLHSQVHALNGIKVCKNDLDSSLPITVEISLASKIDNDVGDGSMLASPTRNNTKPNMSSQKAEDDDLLEVGSDQSALKPNDAEQKGEEGKEMLHSSSEVTEPSDNLLLGDGTSKVVEGLNSEFNKYTDFVCADASDLLKDVPSTALNCEATDAENVQETSKDEFKENECAIDDDVAEAEPVRKDDFLDVDGATTELASDVRYNEMEDSYQNEMRDFQLEDVPHIKDSSYPLEIGLWEDGFMNNSDNPEQHEPYRLDVMDAETSALDLHNQDMQAPDYSATGHDTEFLNVDDDELNDVGEDPDDEEAKFAENSGWSSRTRAVSKYLQTMFVKEAEQGRKSLSMDKLLTNKSRKEASRMFFETLVLKTRDYIHVEQQNPVGDINIKPRTRLMKSSF